MNITAFSDYLKRNIKITRYHNTAPVWCCYIEGVDVSDGNFLIGEYGTGVTPEEAIRDYCDRLSNKRIKVGSEYCTVPELTY